MPQASTLPTAGIIALQTARENGKVAAGNRVLVNGGAGGVGLLCVQIAKADGATVTAVDGPDKHPGCSRSWPAHPFTDQIPRGSFSSRPKLEYLHALKDLADAGHVRPVVDRTFPLEEAAAALEHMEYGRARGRVVLTTGS